MSLVILALLLFGSSHRASPQCGVERWAVKTLADAEASEVSDQVVPSTIEELRALSAPPNLHALPDHRHSPVEKTHYLIHALLLGYKQEADLDYHLVLASPLDSKLTMIAEIPSKQCVPLKLASQENGLRVRLAVLFGKPSAVGRMKYLAKPAHIIIEGVGFFDFLHGQTGVAPNGIELHPVTRLAVEEELVTQ